jgi:hypothetical protein
MLFKKEEMLYRLLNKVFDTYSDKFNITRKPYKNGFIYHCDFNHFGKFNLIVKSLMPGITFDNPKNFKTGIRYYYDGIFDSEQPELKIDEAIDLLCLLSGKPLEVVV